MLIGEDISPALVEAIEQSRASIVLLSPNYVDSTWCLEELVKILECKEQIVLPVCYGVDPSETSRKRGTYYKDTFARHASMAWSLSRTGGGLLRQWLIMLDMMLLMFVLCQD
ncbi:TMV resistance protein [Salix suchowensis]|nr:TMV resistance protein [Salix suchowensis]